VGLHIAERPFVIHHAPLVTGGCGEKPILTQPTLKNLEFGFARSNVAALEQGTKD
jgi:hypothetical protein